MSIADEIKARLDIVNYVQQYVPLKRAGKSYKACCPFHNERTPSFVVNPDSQSWRCFGACSEGGDVISFAMKKNGWTFSEALRELGQQVGVEVEQATPEQRAQYDRLDALRGLVQAVADAYHHALVNPSSKEAEAALRYTRQKRGFSEDTIRQFMLGYAPVGWTLMLDHLRELGYSQEDILDTGMAIRNEESGRVYDRFRNRLMIPIRDERGRVIGFGARALDPDDEPKYLNSPQTPLFDKSRTLFGLDTARIAIRESGTVVVVEGYMDAIQAQQAGFRNVVAQMGTAMTETQVRMLARSAKRVVLALDADAAGQNATMRSLETARQTLQADYGGRLSLDMRILQIPDAKDPDDVIREHPERWAALVEAALPAVDFVIEVETAGLDANPTVQEREAVARRLLPLLMASEDQLYRTDNVQKLARRLRIPEREMLGWVDTQRPGGHGRAKTAQERGVSPAAGPASGAAPAKGQVTAFKRAPQGEALEYYCLRLLLMQPDAYYAVNRKLRELAHNDVVLLNGPLQDWCAEDFLHSEARTLMVVVQQALEQDDQEILAYLRDNADPMVRSQVEMMLADDFERARQRTRNVLSNDLFAAWDRNRRHLEGIDPVAELVEKVLQLRKRRLLHESEQMFFLQVEASSDPEMEARVSREIELSSRARGLIELELQKQVSAVRG